MKISRQYVEAYKAREMTIYDIAEKVNRSPSTVYKALIAEPGVDTSTHRHRMEERNQQIWDAFQEHKNLSIVGRMFDITKERVRQIVNKYRQKEEIGEN